MKGKYKLVGHTSFDDGIEGFQLFNLEKDPYELENIAGDNQSMARELKQEMDGYLHELTASPHLLNPPRISIGTEHENPVYLNRNDAAGKRGIWTQEEVFGKWLVPFYQARGTRYFPLYLKITRKD
jgi:arylsulfatase